MLSCPVCDDPVSAEDRFCEHCGTSLLSAGSGYGGAPGVRAAVHASGAGAAPAPAAEDSAPCARCGARLAAGACPRCGLRRRPGDHSELRLGPGTAAGVSDRGLRHERNEDAMALRAAAQPGASGPEGSAVAAVVCDGVSSSPRPETASRAAAAAGSAALGESLEGGVGTAESLSAALQRAGRAVAALADSAVQAPACTFAAAAVPPSGPLGVAWVGDSRAYWLSGGPPAAPSAQLTRDDSWSEAMVAMSVLTPQQAADAPQAHALIAWLGADYGGAAGRVASFDPGGAGRLLLCSDGLWNHLPDPVDLAALVRGAGPDPLAAARACVRLALERGGHDNVTAVVIDVPGPAAAEGDV
ncbi:protein phosphatase 2C domain-containing protein [Streptomonospora wellingtoniae]|uniref:Protein phosphatase 2C domain-containing protein n=1 Tax=Streptomonospora wellingtoniae TaxID=3075544 RepID=A0ABU2KNS2_9ACTN|nr:protein phosphatase 2C domain-containing protein [Streptomonospora sp. DSM 45055]MDT0300788.1 protein phosphatase 2C domain-containing protein [Streptomonospora sp. DSM 45055]